MYIVALAIACDFYSTFMCKHFEMFKCITK